MALIYPQKIPHRIIQYARIAFVVLFVTSSIIMVSFHMSSRTYVPQMRGVSLENCETSLIERRRSLEVKSGSGKSRSFGAANIPSLPELKSFRNKLDKVITIIEEKSGEKPKKNNAAKEKEPPDGSFSGESSQDRRLFPSNKKSKTIVPNFFGSMNQNFTKYYNGTFVRHLVDGRTLPKLRDALYINITRLKPAEDVPLHPLSQQEPYRSRMLGFQELCYKYPNEEFSHYIDLKRLIRDDYHRTLMCVVPKAACTTWKSIIYYLTGNSKLKEAFSVKRTDLVIDSGNMKSMARTLAPRIFTLHSWDRLGHHPFYVRESTNNMKVIIRGSNVLRDMVQDGLILAYLVLFGVPGRRLGRQGIIGRINNFTKFMVTRHPFHRLVSAFRSKFERREPSYVMTHGRQIAQRILETYLNGSSVKYTKKTRIDVLTRITNLPTFQKLNYETQVKVLDIATRGYRGNITFEEFLRYGVAINAEKVLHFDIHWRPQHLLCNPCAINYDFVIRFEDLERESNMLLDYIQRNDPVEGKIKIPGGSPAAVTDSVAKKFFEKISADLKEEIRQIYEKDFLYFSYDPDNF